MDQERYKITKDHFVELNKMIDKFEEIVMASSTDAETIHAVKTCVIHSKEIILWFDDEKISRAAYAVWDAEHSLVEYIKLKSDLNDKEKEINDEAIYILTIMDNMTTGSVLYW